MWPLEYFYFVKVGIEIAYFKFGLPGGIEVVVSEDFIGLVC